MSIATVSKADGQSWIGCLNHSPLTSSLNCGSAVPSLMYAGKMAFFSSGTLRPRVALLVGVICSEGCRLILDLFARLHTALHEMCFARQVFPR